MINPNSQKRDVRENMHVRSRLLALFLGDRRPETSKRKSWNVSPRKNEWKKYNIAVAEAR